MKTIFKYMSIAVAAATLTGCSDFLDKKDPTMSSEGYFETELGISEGTNAVYNSLCPQGDWSCPTYYEWDNWSPYGMVFREATVGLGSGIGITPDSGNISGFWGGFYKIISYANNVIYGGKDVWMEKSEDTQRIYNECRVLRAFAYVNLLSMFGDVIWMQEPGQLTDYDKYVSPKEEIMEWVLQELEEAAYYLPWTPSARGRVTKAFAYGLKARAALIAAGFNYGGKATEYYGIARDATKLVMEQGGLDLAPDFIDLFTTDGQAKASTQKELILEYMYCDDETDLTGHYGVWGSGYQATGLAGDATYRMPTNLIVDIFECKDGLRIDESPLYNPKRPFQNRDPRMHNTVVGHGDTIDFSADQGATVEKIIVNVYDAKTRWTRKGRWAACDNPDVTASRNTNTFVLVGLGYLWRKYVADPKCGGTSQAHQNIVLMRYPEILLTYAEAKIELGELDQSVTDAINKVRRRSGMPDFEKVRPDRVGNQDLMRQIVRRERKAELAWEGLLLTDYRRWDIGDLLNATPRYGYPLKEIKYSGLDEKDIPDFNWSSDGRSNLNDVPSYPYKDKLNMRCPETNWQPKYRYFPYPQGECNKNPNLVNENW